MFNPTNLLLLTAVLTKVIASPSTCMGIVCPTVNMLNHRLVLGSPSQHDASGQQSVLSCQYDGAPVCRYASSDTLNPCTFRPTGILNPLSATCPSLVGDTPTSGQCPLTDNNGVPLLQSNIRPNSEDNACRYVGQSATAQCKYFAGQLDRRDISCPLSLTGSPPPPSSNSCPPFNPSNNRLTSETTDGSNIVCNFFNANGCTYAPSNGKYISGPKDTCPSAITIKATPAPAGALEGSNALSVDAAAAVDTKPVGTSKSTVISRPILIALLAMNAALVLAVLTIGAVWVLGRPTPGTRESGYSSVGGKAAVPRTHSDLEV
ncbi:hypothetical protein C8R46DRAFT_1075530 [Mycena filopes]|nr:hypothetical protein C8R46DRAFT_1075530 [Mycena filopes]